MSGCLNVNVKPPCSIFPTSARIADGNSKIHTVDECERTIILNYEAGPALGNNPVTSEPNRYDIYSDGDLIASTNGWVGGSFYDGNPEYPQYQPIVGGPIGVISGVKLGGITNIVVTVGGNSASLYYISCS
jgi:hypothetical protein